MTLRLTLLVWACALALPARAAEPARDLQGPEVVFKVDEVDKLALPPAAGDFVVTGTRTYDGWFLKADRLVFKPDARLVFSRAALSNRRHFFIVTREIVVADGGRPGLITWERGPNAGAPGGLGQAPTGSPANSEGQPGGAGAPGSGGIEGAAGESAPNLTIFVLSVPASGPSVDMAGQAGGPGGQGQKGGSGGVGGWGNPAAQNAFNCTRGAGNGAQGGRGGSGGVGGPGGRGGHGGSVTVISDASLLGTLSQRFRVSVAGGEGGPAGAGGPGGDGGPGGRGGQEALPWCRGNGSQGPAGERGQDGPGGTAGPTENAGDFFVGGISAPDFERVFKGQ